MRFGQSRVPASQNVAKKAIVSISSAARIVDLPPPINLIGGERTSLAGCDRELRQAIIEAETGLVARPADNSEL